MGGSCSAAYQPYKGKNWEGDKQLRSSMIAGPPLPCSPCPAPSPVCPTSLDFDSFSSSYGKHIIPSESPVPSPQTLLPLLPQQQQPLLLSYHKQVESPTTVSGCRASGAGLQQILLPGGGSLHTDRLDVFGARSGWGAPPAAAVGASATLQSPLFGCATCRRLSPVLLRLRSPSAARRRVCVSSSAWPARSIM